MDHGLVTVVWLEMRMTWTCNENFLDVMNGSWINLPSNLHLNTKFSLIFSYKMNHDAGWMTWTPNLKVFLFFYLNLKMVIWTMMNDNNFEWSLNQCLDDTWIKTWTNLTTCFRWTKPPNLHALANFKSIKWIDLNPRHESIPIQFFNPHQSCITNNKRINTTWS